MNILFIFLFMLFLDFNGSQTPVKGLKALYEFPAGSHIGYCDLSHQQLKTMPNLSMYHIDTLDISYNEIRSLDNALLFPQDLVFLNISHNNMKFDMINMPKSSTDIGTKRFVGFYPELFPMLEQLDVAYNRVERLVLPPSIRHVNAEHCELLSIRLCLPYDQQHKITYLNLNDNPELYCVVNFDVNTIDTLLTSNCANGYPLIKAPDE